MKELAKYSVSCSGALIVFVRSVLLFFTFRPIIALIYIYILFPASVECGVDGTMISKL